MTVLTFVFSAAFPDFSGKGGVSRGDADHAESADWLAGLGVADRTLVGRISGEREAEARVAFDGLYEATYERLARFATRFVHDPDAANDLVQEVFVALWTSRTTWRAPMGSAPYLYRAVRNRALKRLRHDDVVRRACDDVAAMSSVAPAASIDVEQTEFDTALAAALAELPERRRTAFLLRAVDELSYDAIGATLGVSGPAAYKQVLAAVRLLRIRLERFAG